MILFFSTEKWKGLSPGEQSKHMLSNCVACGCLDSMERGMVEWNSGTVEWWNGGIVE